jgi:chemotaxis protein histidine kinase CheA
MRIFISKRIVLPLVAAVLVFVSLKLQLQQSDTLEEVLDRPVQGRADSNAPAIVIKEPSPFLQDQIQQRSTEDAVQQNTHRTKAPAKQAAVPLPTAAQVAQQTAGPLAPASPLPTEAAVQPTSAVAKPTAAAAAADPTTAAATAPAAAARTAAAAPPLGPDTALLVICANRPEYLQHSLGAVQQHYPRQGAAAAPVVRVSQDGDSPAVEKVISSFAASMQGTAAVQHLRHPLPASPPTGNENTGETILPVCCCIVVATACIRSDAFAPLAGLLLPVVGLLLLPLQRGDQ